MIDIHSHILYGLDDGAATLEQSLAMVKMAAESGTTDLVATPHSSLEYKFDPDLVESRLAELRTLAGPVPRLYSGCDFHLSYDNIQDAVAHPAKYTINQRGYLLVEFSDLAIFHTTPEIFDRLLTAGMTPIITHPERNSLLQHRLEDLRTWAGMGCLLQVTASSFLGRFGRKAREFSELLMRERLVHFVASDAHDTRYRPPVLDEVRLHLVKQYGEEMARRLTEDNPRAVVEGRALPEVAEAPARGKPAKWWAFWR